MVMFYKVPNKVRQVNSFLFKHANIVDQNMLELDSSSTGLVLTCPTVTLLTGKGEKDESVGIIKANQFAEFVFGTAENAKFNMMIVPSQELCQFGIASTPIILPRSMKAREVSFTFLALKQLKIEDDFVFGHLFLVD